MILIYVPQMAPFGGMEKHVCAVARILVTRGVDCVILTTSNSLGPAIRKVVKMYGVKLREMNCERGKASAVRKMAWISWQRFCLRKSKFRGVYTNGQSGLARCVWKIGEAKAILHHHHTSADLKEREGWSELYLDSTILAKSIVACSRSAQREIAMATKRHDVSFLPYVTQVIAGDSTAKKCDFSQRSKVTFGFFGRLVKTKGVDMICRLSEEEDLSFIKWEIHGAGEEYSADDFTRFPNVKYMGEYFSTSQQRERLSKIDAVALFSVHNEGMPLSLIEATANGLPWIATDKGGTRELAGLKENCEILRANASFEETKAGLKTLVARMKGGDLDPLKQIAAYGAKFASQTVGRMWLSALNIPTQ